MIQVFVAQQLVVSCRQTPSCDDRRGLSTITASTHSMSRGRLCARATRSRGVCRAATPLSATNSAAPCWPPISASPRHPAGRVKIVSLASAVPAARPRRPLPPSRPSRSWRWRLPTRPGSSSTSVTACAPCSRACPVPPQDPTRLHAGADRSGERARVRARVRVRLAPGGQRISCSGRRLRSRLTHPASRLTHPANRARTRTRARTRARWPSGSDHDPEFPDAP
jgi:hypothetical protein